MKCEASDFVLLSVSVRVGETVGNEEEEKKKNNDIIIITNISYRSSRYGGTIDRRPKFEMTF